MNEKCIDCNSRTDGHWHCNNCHEEILGDELHSRDNRIKELEEIIKNHDWECQTGDLKLQADLLALRIALTHVLDTASGSTAKNYSRMALQHIARDAKEALETTTDTEDLLKSREGALEVVHKVKRMKLELQGLLFRLEWLDEIEKKELEDGV